MSWDMKVLNCYSKRLYGRGCMAAGIDLICVTGEIWKMFEFDRNGLALLIVIYFRSSYIQLEPDLAFTGSLLMGLLSSMGLRYFYRIIFFWTHWHYWRSSNA